VKEIRGRKLVDGNALPLAGRRLRVIYVRNNASRAFTKDGGGGQP
jgi:hypothetical protein